MPRFQDWHFGIYQDSKVGIKKRKRGEKL